MSIYGGWNVTLWSGGSPGNPSANIGIVTRPDPVFDPSIISVDGTGRRGLYDIVLGVRDPRLTVEWAPAYLSSSLTPVSDATSFIRSFQAGAEIAALHYLLAKGPAAVGLTFANCRIDRLAVSCRAGDILRCTAEILAKSVALADASCPWGGSELTKALAWHYLDVLVAPKSTPTTPVENTKWHEWTYEVRNNIERLINVNDKTTRSLEIRSRRVTGSLTWDFDSLTEYSDMVGVDASKLFALQVKDSDGNYLLGASGYANAQWGRLEAPVGPEDLKLKRFPFTSLHLTPE